MPAQTAVTASAGRQQARSAARVRADQPGRPEPDGGTSRSGSEDCWLSTSGVCSAPSSSAVSGGGPSAGSTTTSTCSPVRSLIRGTPPRRTRAGQLVRPDRTSHSLAPQIGRYRLRPLRPTSLCRSACPAGACRVGRQHDPDTGTRPERSPCTGSAAPTPPGCGRCGSRCSPTARWPSWRPSRRPQPGRTQQFTDRIAFASTGSELAQFVADPGGRLIGHAGGAALPDEPDVTVVFAVYVTPARRGGTVLAELIDAVAGWSRAAGRPGLMLEVVVGNDRAVRAVRTGSASSTPACACRTPPAPP